MKIYTKTGDTGTTGLYGGKRVLKDDIRIEAYGSVDELNSFIGLLNTTFHEATQNYFLTEVQKRLFTIGSNLASDPEKKMITPDITDDDIQTLENAMDTMEQLLEPLKNFILPGGDISVAYAHVCRSICRRAERKIISLDRQSPVDPKVIIYINRLSDYFFVLSRYIAHRKDIPEIPWIPRKS
ncbi:MAG: cob(I)yrinic acid a,c-diamide adenosyltransferase [Saprospiraceae bacterium]|jgi:cob(I)alamin adenosyltransferase|nr:cob(I)yrinic acid a,c-diamide adenosyltransferase [Saprospiraceae bacterium]